MANELTDAGEILALDLLAGGAQTIAAPLKLALLTALGSDASAGTEVTGGSYARQTMAVTAAAAGASANSAALTFAGMPACTVVGFEVYDSSATPKRLWSGTVGTSKTYTAGDTATVAVGAQTFGLN